MRQRIPAMFGLALASSLSLAAQTRPDSSPPPPQTPWFALTGPKEVTATNAASTPHFNQTINITDTPPDGIFGVPYNFQFTASNGTAPYFYSSRTTPPGLTLSTSGQISGTPTQVGFFSTFVNVNDGPNGDFGSGTFFINIALAVNGTPPGGSVGIKYPNFQFTAAGGSGSYNFQVFNPGAVGVKHPNLPFTAARGGGNPVGAVASTQGLPPGLTLATTGVLSGTPTQAGNYSAIIQAIDNQTGSSGSQTVSFSITSCTPTFLTPATLTSGDIGSPYSQAITVTGCTLPYSFAVSQLSSSSTALPPGLSLTQPSATGTSAVISGTPTTNVGTPFTFNVSVTEANKGSATSTFSITINPALGIAAATPLPPATVGQPYTQSLMPTGGTTPYSSITLDTPPPGMTLDSPTGLLHGTPPNGSASATPYSFTATLIDNIAASVRKTFQLTIMTGQPSLLISPTTLNFTAVAGGPPPASQAISLAPASAASSGSKFTALADGGQTGTKPPFTLTVSPSTGPAPAQLVVNVDQGSLGAGNTSGRIRILDQNNIETDVAVNLAVTTANPQLQVAPSRLRFAASTTMPGMLEQDLTVSVAGSTGSLGFSASVVNASSWISSVTPLTGSTSRNSPVFVRVIVNTAGQTVGSHSDTIHFSSSGGNVDVPVMLIVTNGGAALGVNVTGLRYQAQQGGGFSNNEVVKVLNVGDPSTTVNWTAQIVNGANIISLGATSGTATSTTPGLLPINLNSAATQLAPGAYYAMVSITDPNSSNSPVYVIIILDLSPAGSPPIPNPDPAGLFFAVVAGGAQSPTQTITMNTSSAQPVALQLAVSTADGGNWLVVNSVSSQASGQTPGSATVAVNPAALTPGVYYGQVTLSIGATVRGANITAVVLPAGSTIPSPHAQQLPHAAGCSPSKVAITEIGLANNFAVPAKWPATLIVQLNDDCANALTTGSVVASFSNGDVPLSLRNVGQGANYSATWQPNTTSSQTVVTLNATSGALAPASLQLVGGVTGNQAPSPVLSSGGTVNAFNPVSGGALSPGTIVEMFGSGLAATNTATGTPPLPVLFSGTQVLVGGLSAPLYYVSSGQLNVQIPAELPANQSYPILVSVNGAITVPDQLDMVTLAPGVDASTDGFLIAQHGADFSLVSAANPAKPGETLVVYLLGMGATTPPVPSGQPAPSSPLAQVTAQPTITVNGQNAHLDFAGLTPGFAGLYQINFDVPATAASGNLTVVISQNGVPTNTSTLPVSH